MKRFLSLFVAPVLASVVVAWGLHLITGYSSVNSVNMLDHSGTDIAHIVCGFLFGFLPCLIYGLAIDWQEKNMPVFIQEMPEIQVLPIYEGLIITSIGSNCALRVKKLHINNILEYNNPGYLDYL